MRTQLNWHHLAVRIPLVLLGGIFVAESAIMTAFALWFRDSPNRWLEVVVDASVLTLTVAPLLYWVIVRPLRVMADERSRLLAHVYEAQEAERQRIARDLHDEIGQSFTSLLVQLRLLEDASPLGEAQQQLAGVRQLSSQLYDRVRNLARGLHPTVLDDLGLVEALRRLAEDHEAMHGVPVRLLVQGVGPQRVDPKIETTAYRIVQESLTNCAKHAQATQIEVQVRRTDGELLVTVTDDGRGFDAAHVLGATHPTTFGLASMRERALLAQGELKVRSRPGAGTKVSLRIPLPS